MNGKEGERQEIALPEGPGGIRNDHVSSKWRVLGAEDMVPVFLRQRGTGPLAQGSFTQTKTLLSSGTANSKGPFNNEGTTSQHHKSVHMYLFKLSSRGGGKVSRGSRGSPHMSAPPRDLNERRINTVTMHYSILLNHAKLYLVKFLCESSYDLLFLSSPNVDRSAWRTSSLCKHRFGTDVHADIPSIQ